MHPCGDMVMFLNNFTKGRNRLLRVMRRKITVDYWCKFVASYLYSGIYGFNRFVFICLNACFCSRI